MKRVIFAGLLNIFIATVCSAMSLKPQAIELQLVATDSVCTVDSVTGRSGELPLKVFLHNSSRKAIWLLIPAEGDLRDLRLPLFGWSVLEDDRGEHLQELWPDSTNSGVFNFSRSSLVSACVPSKGLFEIQNELDLPSGLLPGTYRIVFYYQNYPRDALKLNRPNYHIMHEEYQCSLMSNEVTIRVKGK